MQPNELNILTEVVIGAAFRISNTLGAGFLEKVYENAMEVELRSNNVQFTQQQPFTVRYKGFVVGDYIADFVIQKQLIVEVKALTSLDKAHTAQCLNYLKASGLSLALLINFGTPRVQIKRIAGR
ncbi:MAG: GxxExxY protein [Anaerolineales bacterium]|nr:GxxExxY protein [Anaerolineales bacterium]MBX3005787.1 GxxExxY protein [Anaerolineales bacterium]